ncbi:hypothetical protein ACQP2E_13245 [Actinoplanes sp. CA-015351]|uniref:hypothetical protein n=1 Tax=Actinoplanes sp. CA-015351 TaxID=3239897 RepID=UPI003D969298
MSRVFGIELRRSAALGSALILLVVGVLALYFAEGIGFSDGWMQLAMTQRLYLALLWPLALAAGAWQARREHRSKVGELFASTPRRVAQRAMPILGVMALAVIGAYLAMSLAGGLWIVATARYLPVAVFAVTAVGVLSLIAAVWIGLAIGRLLPWPVTAPAAAVAGLGLLLSLPGATRPRGWLALVFSPIYEMNMPDAFAAVPGRVSASQAIWLGALAVTAVMLFASTGWRLRVAAVLPVLLGAALSIAVMPHGGRVVISAIDPVAKELVCAERVCLSRVHTGLRSEIAGPAADGLAVLAKLPEAPALVHEDTSTFVPDDFPRWRTDVVFLRVEAGSDGGLENKDRVRADVVAGAFASDFTCGDAAPLADRYAAAYWLIGREPVAGPDAFADDVALTAVLWKSLRDMPADEAQARVVALRQAALTCSAGDGLFPQDKP